jgi:uncharacterized protein (DUF305 family)
VPRRRLTAALLLALAAVAGCDNGPAARPADTAPVVGHVGPARPVPSGSVAAPNGVDLLFAKMMVAHHAQAISMSTTLLAKNGVPEWAQNIAGYIAHDQQREINQMNEWLQAWHQPPVDPADPLINQLHGTGVGHGMLTGAQLAEITRAAPAAVAELYLRRMIEHHLGAITMARSALDAGTNVYILGLAKHIINEQSTENDAMRRLLEELG